MTTCSRPFSGARGADIFGGVRRAPHIVLRTGPVRAIRRARAPDLGAGKAYWSYPGRPVVTAPPVHLLERMLQQLVSIQLKDGLEISGRLVGADEHLNLVLDDAQAAHPEGARRLGRIVLRGSSVISLNAPSPAPGKAAR
jgi:small nuclear ribonucleoprotein (snRNP)-like protein